MDTVRARPGTTRLTRGLLIAAMLAGAMSAAARAADPAPPDQAAAAADVLGSVRRLIDDLAKNPSTVVAEIGDRSITRGDVADALSGLPAIDGGTSLDVLYHNAVQAQMAQQALVIRARETGIDKDPAVQRRIAAAAGTILGNEYLRRSIRPMTPTTGKSPADPGPRTCRPG